MNNKLIVGLSIGLVLLLSVMIITSYTKPIVTPFDSELNEIEYISDSDDISSIEKDLNDTNFDDLDKELNQINDELN